MTAPTPVPDGPIETAPQPLFLPGDEQRDVLLRELGAAGVTLGAYDHRMLEWLAGWETGTVLTVASWIGRAYAAGRAAGGAR